LQAADFFRAGGTVRGRGRVGGDAGGSEAASSLAASSSMASDRASGIRRRHSTKVVARLSFGRAAPTRAQLIPYGAGDRGRRCGLLRSAASGAALVNPERASAYPRTRVLGRNGAASRGNKATVPVASCANRFLCAEAAMTVHWRRGDEKHASNNSFSGSVRIADWMARRPNRQETLDQ
jgi:hypothetical protein